MNDLTSMEAPGFVWNFSINILKFCRKSIQLADETKALAEKYNFEVKGYSFEAKKEDLRKPRIVRVSIHANRVKMRRENWV